MNFLAHLALSGNSPNIIMGNFVADFMKGKLTDERIKMWPEGVGKGILLHREIDYYTDTHHKLREMKHLMRPKFGKWSGVVSDIYFDYFLANHFGEFYPVNLDNFVTGIHQIIEENRELIPAKMVPLADAMMSQQWLKSYLTFEGIGKTFKNLSTRNELRSGLKGAEVDLEENTEFYQAYFLDFYPDLQNVCDEFLKK